MRRFAVNRHSLPISVLLGLIGGGLSAYNEYRYHHAPLTAAAWFVVWFAIGLVANEALGDALRVEIRPAPATIRQSAWMAFAFLAIFGAIWFAFERYIEQNGGPVGREIPHSDRYRR